VGTFEQNPYFTGGVSGGYPVNVFNLPAPIAFRGVATNFRNGLVHKWNAAIQRELPMHSMLEIAYVGNHQAHQLFQPDWNACPNLGTTNSAISCNTLRPTPYIGGISGTASFGRGNYHGMTARYEKRYSGGLWFLASYVRARARRYRNNLSGSTGFGPTRELRAAIRVLPGTFATTSPPAPPTTSRSGEARSTARI
jgi:hypothetical protein